MLTPGTHTRHPTDRVFSHALATVRRLPRTGSSRPPPAARLRLYGLYKQSMEGDVDAILPRPALPPLSPPLNQQQAADAADQTGNNKQVGSALTRYGSRQLRTREAQAEIEKWDAWHACKGMSRTAAKKAYIRTLIETMKEYASGTQESRELVGELEFVWRQVMPLRASENVTQRRRKGVRSDSSGGDAGRRRLRPRQSSRNDGMTLLSPVGQSEADGSVVQNEEVSDASDSASDAADSSSPSPSPKRPGRKRVSKQKRNNNNNNSTGPSAGVEAHLRHLSTEIAALREQLASHYLLAPSGYSPYVYQNLSFRWRLWYRVLAWVRWAVWVAVRQAAIQLSLLGFALLYGRWKGDRRLETWLRARVRVALSWARRGHDWRWLNRIPFG
ncbi:hypothetical protein DV735_g1424, partial [Chaetothyriales sp. CBS 134920]